MLLQINQLIFLQFLELSRSTAVITVSSKTYIFNVRDLSQSVNFQVPIKPILKGCLDIDKKFLF